MATTGLEMLVCVCVHVCLCAPPQPTHGCFEVVQFWQLAVNFGLHRSDGVGGTDKFAVVLVHKLLQV